MDSNTVKTADNELWISTQDKIISFRFVPGYLHKEFKEHADLLEYIFVNLDGQGYRFQ